jgi:hypothetical protein
MRLCRSMILIYRTMTMQKLRIFKNLLKSDVGFLPPYVGSYNEADGPGIDQSLITSSPTVWRIGLPHHFGSYEGSFQPA